MSHFRFIEHQNFQKFSKRLQLSPDPLPPVQILNTPLKFLRPGGVLTDCDLQLIARPIISHFIGLSVYIIWTKNRNQNPVVSAKTEVLYPKGSKIPNFVDFCVPRRKPI